MQIPAIIALAGGSYIFLGVIVLLLVAVIFGYFTYEGSGINAHPAKGGDSAPGSREPSSASGKGRTSDEHFDDDAQGGAFETHGTQ
jgi:hypothetical protein